MKLIPPPEAPRHTNVDWPLLEKAIGLRYPDSFKEFVSVYGSCHWFDKVLPIYTCPKTARDTKQFLKYVGETVHWIKTNARDEHFKEIEVPVYPASGGVFPFLNDIDGPLYYWRTQSSNPNRWPIYCWMRGPITILEGWTIADMLLGFLERDPTIIRLWGDVRDFDPERIRIDNLCAE